MGFFDDVFGSVGGLFGGGGGLAPPSPFGSPTGGIGGGFGNGFAGGLFGGNPSPFGGGGGWGAPPPPMPWGQQPPNPFGGGGFPQPPNPFGGGGLPQPPNPFGGGGFPQPPNPFGGGGVPLPPLPFGVGGNPTGYVPPNPFGVTAGPNPGYMNLHPINATPINPTQPAPAQPAPQASRHYSSPMTQGHPVMNHSPDSYNTIRGYGGMMDGFIAPGSQPAGQGLGASRWTGGVGRGGPFGIQKQTNNGGGQGWTKVPPPTISGVVDPNRLKFG